MMSTKRAAEVDQNGDDTFAVCTICNRLSSDLRTCDKCGSSLSDDNAAHCYSSDPKRLCADPQTNRNTTNKLSDQVPVTTTAASSGVTDNSVRPQALYVNVNNHAIPVFTAPSSSESLAFSRPLFVASSGISSSLSSANQNGSVTLLGSVGTSSSRMVSTNSRPIACSTSSSIAIVPQRVEIAAPLSQINLPSYNLQPPPPPFAASVARLPGFVSGSVQGTVLPAPSAASHGTSAQNVQVNAVQIRIGSKKFKPSSPVTFKDDGILFTLKDYSYAPVLLNARAILKCKANLNTYGYPVFFLFLENSCMRQIRNIFGLTANDFSHNNPVELRRCISIFPMFGNEGKSQAQSAMYTIKRAFEAMVRRYPRNSSILEDISNDQTIDILLDQGNSDLPVRGDGAASDSSSTDNHVSQPVNPSPVVSTAPNVNQSASSSVVSVSSAAATQASQNQSQPQSVTTNGSRVALTSSAFSTAALTTLTVAPPVVQVTGFGSSTSTVVALTTTTNPSQTPGAQLNRIQSSAPVLQIPKDQSHWQLMQKGLVANGVYHVLMPNGHRQYCLWNGKQLVPCFVQNTEVQLSCMRVRIGSLLAQSLGQIRVKADQSSGIHFTVKSDQTGTQEVAIAPDDIKTCEVCFSNVAVIFILLTNAGADKLRKKLKLSASGDLAYDVNGAVLNGVNRDQEEALMQMKFNRAGASEPLVKAINVTTGIMLLAQIKLGTKNNTTIMEYITSKHVTGTLGFEKLVNDIASSAVITSNAVIDDDDDVIMTQEEVGVKCPYTQQVMKNPARNIICGHNYERLAIHEFILRKKGNAKCPYAGCANLVPLRMEDLVENAQLRDYISTHGLASKT